MQLSQRITNITNDGDDGWAVFNTSRKMIAEGIDVLELSIGEHDIRTEPAILDAMYQSAVAGNTGYAIVPGRIELRREVATRIEARTGIKTGAENIVITPGGQSALFAAHMAVTNPGDTALFLDPYYATYPGTIRAVGAVAKPIQTRSKNAFQPSAEELAPYGKNATSLLVNSPNNPTGVVYSRETIETISEFAKANDLWLISDEVYDTQIWDGQHHSPRAVSGMEDRTLVIGSMSKSHAMTGSRVGWVCGPSDVIGHLINLSTCTTYGVPGYIQDAALFALNQGSDLEEAVAAPFRRRRAIAQDLLAGQNNVRLIPSSGAMYLMLDIRSTGMSGNDFANALLEQEKIAVMPGESFGQAAAGHLRVAMTIEDSRFVEALRRLLDFANKRTKS